MNIFDDWVQKIKLSLQESGLAQEGQFKDADFSRIVVETPRDPQHGDLSTNVSMVLARVLQRKPFEIARRIVAVLEKDEAVENIAIAGAGFINIKLKKEYWISALQNLLDTGTSYGSSNYGKQEKINVEFVSTNPTGPIHIGHCRGAVVGDVLSNLLKFSGYDVTKEYYVNDAGVQIKVLANSCFLRYKEALGQEIGEFPSDLYPGDYLVPVGKFLVEKFGDSLLNMTENERVEVISPIAIDAMMKLIKDDLALLNVHHDVFFSERALHSDNAFAIRSAINQLTFDGYVYEGKLPPPKGHDSFDWEDRDQLLFNSTKAGDDVDRPLMKADGSFTYFAADVAYFKNKYDRKFKEMIYVLGSDHSGYIKRLEAVGRAIAGDNAELTVILTQMVNLICDSKAMRMSKRAGNYVTMRDVIEEVGVDSVRFMMIYRKSDMPIDFDFNKVTEQSKDNPVFYVQYAHARCHSILKQAKEQLSIEDNWLQNKKSADYLNLLLDDSELTLIKKLVEYPNVIQLAAKYREPHRLCFYLYDLASAFHAHWNKGNDNQNLRFVQQDNLDLTLARMLLVQSIIYVLQSGLKLVGVSAPQEMR